jgi:pyruvate/2-oxoglutarate dehydrogenase complex dihydrolipoamide dehydrogenase (E3) component
MLEDPKEFDLIVIGGGPAGIVGATTAAAFGKTVTVVDCHHELGGAGANTGTVPSKTLRETALAFSGMRSRNLYGVDLSLRQGSDRRRLPSARTKRKGGAESCFVGKVGGIAHGRILWNGIV